MRRKMMLAIGSTCSLPGDIAGNVKQIADFAQRAAANGCDVLLTPEMSASGYGSYQEVLHTAEIAGEGEIYTALAKTAHACGLVVTAGFAEKAQAGVHLSQYIIFPDTSFVVQRKHRVTPLEYPLLPAVPLYYDEAEEIGHVVGEPIFTYFSIKGIKTALVICADMGIKNLHHILEKDKVELLLVPVAAGGVRQNKVNTQEMNTREGLKKYLDIYNGPYFFPRDAIEECIRYQRGFAVVNMCGYDGKALYHGGSGSIISPMGVIEGFVSGIENVDAQKPLFACGEIDFANCITRP